MFTYRINYSKIIFYIIFRMTTKEAIRATRLDIVALTISPPDLKLSLEDTWIFHLKKLALIDSDFKVFPETDIKGRLHYHGWIHKDKYYPESLKKLEDIGFIKMKTIFDMNKWLKYCKKELKITKTMLGLPKKFKIIDNNYVSKFKPINQSRDIRTYEGFGEDYTYLTNGKKIFHV